MRNWSIYQRAIFDDVAFGEGHTVVQARAGSGKTSTIVEAFGHVPAGKSVLMVAFNKAIAAELSRRAPPGVAVKTLHGFGLAALTSAFGRVQVNGRKVDDMLRAAIRTAEEARESEAEANNEPPLDVRVKLAEDRTRDERRDLVKAIAFAKATLAEKAEDIEQIVYDFGLDVAADRIPRFCARALEVLEDCRLMTSVVDFDDMVWLPVVLGLRVRQYDRVFVDETQDMNSAQIELALRACKPGGRICAVGDDRQAIYAFRGADEYAMENVKRRLGVDEPLPLSVTYRCARAIVEVAQEVVDDLEAAPGAEAGAVRSVPLTRLRSDARPGDFVLSRSRAPLIGLCMGFLRDGTPANIAGRDIGAELANRVRNLRARTVLELVERVVAWRDAETQKLLAYDREADPGHIVDTAECIVALTEGAHAVDEVIRRIESLFSDASDDASRIVLSTTHKAKGLERDRVWLLADTFRKRETTEEENLWYVAVTRARRELFLARD